jgi:hypothetical protein
MKKKKKKREREKEKKWLKKIHFFMRRKGQIFLAYFSLHTQQWEEGGVFRVFHLFLASLLHNVTTRLL